MTAPLRAAFEAVQASLQADVVCYVGEINRAGYDVLCQLLRDRPTRAAHAALILVTNGGDAHAGYRIVRALRHNYPKQLAVLVPGLCKSAGTLLVIGAKDLIIADRGELGPLDVQVAKRDELFEFGSGLDIMQALGSVQARVLHAFQQYLFGIRVNAGITTKTAAEMATELVKGLFAPISAQIDPLRLGEMQRATEIAFAYGQRLDSYDKNLKPNALARLVTGYPSHGFVIDRREARDLFHSVRSPSAEEMTLMDHLNSMLPADASHAAPRVFWFEQIVPPVAATNNATDTTTTTPQTPPNSQPQPQPKTDQEPPNDNAATVGVSRRRRSPRSGAGQIN